MNSKRPAIKNPSSIYDRIRSILESARSSAARSVNTAQVAANWLIGREIVEEEQKGKRRAAYGSRLIVELSGRLTSDFGKGYSVNNLEHFRDFYLTYPNLIEGRIPHALRGESLLLPGDEGVQRSSKWTPFTPGHDGNAVGAGLANAGKCRMHMTSDAPGPSAARCMGMIGAE
ncbi:MAG: DUF1016 N-terminal domain-containing protein [bacterium]